MPDWSSVVASPGSLLTVTAVWMPDWSSVVARPGSLLTLAAVWMPDWSSVVASPGSCFIVTVGNCCSGSIPGSRFIVTVGNRSISIPGSVLIPYCVGGGRS